MPTNTGEEMRKAKPTGINPIQQAAIFENHARTVRCDQVIRELVKNSFEACARMKRKNKKFVGQIMIGRLDLPGQFKHKFSCIDNGDGMSKDRVVDYVNNLAETGEQSEDGNFGYGTKVSAYARNKEGIAYQTWHDGESEGSFVRIHKAKEGYYGAEWQQDSNDYRLDLTMDQRPSFIKQNGGSGTIVHLLGQTQQEDTTSMPEDYMTNSLLCGRTGSEHWLLAKLNTTFFTVPDYITLKCRAAEKTFRVAKGHKHHLDFYSKSNERGVLNLTGAKLHYWIVSENDARKGMRTASPAQRQSTCLVKSHLGFMHKQEMIRLEWNREGMKCPLKDWGLTFSHKQIVLIVEPLNHTPDEKRVTLFGPEGKEYRELIPMWREEFKEKMPKCIYDLEQKLMAENTEKEMDLTSLYRKIARDLKQYVDSESGELSNQTDIPLMTGGDRKNTGSRTSNTEGESGDILKESFGQNPYQASIIGEGKRKRVRTTSMNMCPIVHRRKDMEDYELEYNYDNNELSFNMNLKLIDEYVDTVKPDRMKRDLVKRLFVEDMISSLVSRIVYVRGREMGLTDEEKKRCLDGNSLLMSLQDKFSIIEKIKKQLHHLSNKKDIVIEHEDNTRPHIRS